MAGLISLIIRRCCVSRLTIFCALHSIVNMAECASPILKKFEKMNVSTIDDDISDEDDDDSNMIPSDGMCGAYADFKENCNLTIEKVLSVPFRGNRFNIIFIIGHIVYFHTDNILKFLRDVHGATNFVQKTVLLLIQKPLYLAKCKVLGLILRQNKDATGFVSGKDYLFEETLIEKGRLFNELVKPNENFDPFAVQLAHTIFCGFHKLVSSALKEHLPGGTYSNPTETLQETVKL
ncbi:hypothetical protein KUTeg_018184 [Tegillarca granosa]|uniref:Uncharacterized protein n=1 Tax=Tegillarca granosa TaxID=220873 RepID=A0ABQ9EL46_TEGGR|nr:hypothetical protein KUTeg_018184 [Tegillarca granosa]